MNKKRWGVIAVLFGLVLIAVIIFFLFFYKPAATEPAVNQPAATGTEVPTGGVLNQPAVNQPAAIQPVSPLKKAEVKSDDLVRMASAFAERFGSFSNQSNYGNLRDLQIFMTSDMKVWAENYIEEAKLKKPDTSIYYGIVTKSILSEAKQFDADSGLAEVLVKTQRRESAGAAGNSSSFYQDIIIKYQREGGVWRVAGAYWQAK